MGINIVRQRMLKSSTMSSSNRRSGKAVAKKTVAGKTLARVARKTPAKGPRKAKGRVAQKAPRKAAAGPRVHNNMRFERIRYVLDQEQPFEVECNVDGLPEQMFAEMSSWHECVRGFLVCFRGDNTGETKDMWVRVETLKALTNYDLEGVGLVADDSDDAEGGSSDVALDRLHVVSDRDSTGIVCQAGPRHSDKVCDVNVLASKFTVPDDGDGDGAGAMVKGFADFAKLARHRGEVTGHAHRVAVGTVFKFRDLAKKLRSHPNFGVKTTRVSGAFPLGARPAHEDPVPDYLLGSDITLLEYTASNTGLPCAGVALLNVMSELNVAHCVTLYDVIMKKKENLDLGVGMVASLTNIFDMVGKDAQETRKPWNIYRFENAVPERWRQLKEHKDMRLQWLLGAIEPGSYLLTIVDDTGSESHVVGLNFGTDGGMLLDGDEDCSMILSQAALDRCAGKGRKCVGIGEVVRLRLRGAKLKKRRHPAAQKRAAKAARLTQEAGRSKKKPDSNGGESHSGSFRDE